MLKTQLIDRLLLSIHDIHKNIDTKWAVIVEKRAEDIKNKKVKTIPGDQVFKDLLNE